MTTEEWREVPGYNGKYEVSSLGRVRSWTQMKQGELMNPVTVKGGYLRVILYDEFGRSRVHRVHQLVAAAFLGPRPDGMQVRHLDGNPTRNVVENLRWGTASENVQDSIRHGTHAQARKTHCPQGHPYTPENTYTQRGGGRKCRTCQREGNERRHKARVAQIRAAIKKEKAEVA